MKKTFLTALFVVISVTAMGLEACGPPTPVAPTAASTISPPAGPSGVSKLAWEKQWQELVTDARKEGKVNVYSSANPATRTGIGKAFREKYGIELEFVTGRGAEVITRFLGEYRAGIRLADVMIIGAPDLIAQVKPSGSLKPLTPALILPEVLDTKAWAGNKLPIIDKDGQVLGFLAAYTTSLVANTTMVREGQISSYFDLLKPEWKGKILMGDPTMPGGSGEWVSFMLLRALGMEKGRQYMENLIRQQPLIIRDDRLLVEWVARGKNPLVVGPQRQLVSELQAAGAPIKWLRTVEGGFIQPSGGCVVLIDQRPDPNASVVFVNWLLSREGQTVFAKNYGVPSARVDVPVEGIDPVLVASPGDKIFLVDEEWYVERIKVMPAVKEIFQSAVQQ